MDYTSQDVLLGNPLYFLNMKYIQDGIVMVAHIYSLCWRYKLGIGIGFRKHGNEHVVSTKAG
jgi:hypothetical protein